MSWKHLKLKVRVEFVDFLSCTSRTKVVQFKGLFVFGVITQFFDFLERLITRSLNITNQGISVSKWKIHIFLLRVYYLLSARIDQNLKFAVLSQVLSVRVNVIFILGQVIYVVFNWLAFEMLTIITAPNLKLYWGLG